MRDKFSHCREHYTIVNGEVFPTMREFISHLKERNYQKRTVALIENGAWAPAAAKSMTAQFEGMKDITFASNKVTIKIAVNEDVEKQLDVLAEELK